MNTDITPLSTSKMPLYLAHAYRQAEIAFSCLGKKIQKEESIDESGESPLLPYLIHASVLFFLFRDMAAFEWARQQKPFLDSALPSKLRQTPSFNQLQALLKSSKDTTGLVETLSSFQDTELQAAELKQFRDQVIQLGIPSQEPIDSPFPIETVQYGTLATQSIKSWNKLITVYSRLYS